MSSRVTLGMVNTQFLRNLHSNMSRLDHLQNQWATGRKINRPSDDPVGISFAMRYRSELAANEQYKSNIEGAMSWMEYSDSMLGQVGSVMQRLRALTVNGANGTNPEEALESISSEIAQLKDQLLTIANSEFNGKYVFNGQMTDRPPFDKDAPIADTDMGEIRFEIGVGVKIAVNVPGSKIFGGTADDDNIFKVIDEIQVALAAGNSPEVGNALGKLDSRNDKMLLQRAEVGARVNRIELAGERIEDIAINLEAMQSKVEDADMAEIITKIKMSENVYQASLSIGARIMRPSLIDFLR